MGYSIYTVRELNYKVLDGKEVFRVHDERTGQLAFTMIGFYNPKRILRPEDKEATITELMEPVLATIRRKIDQGELSDGFLHVELDAALPGGVTP